MEARHLQIVMEILQKYPYTFYAFGSRVKGTQRRLSDLDLCFKEDIPLLISSQIAEDFEESNLPFKVDLINWKNCDLNFQNLINKDLVVMNKKLN